ncbi:hypothetical protein Lser_V15G33136 [Lactuca serriola]
MSSPSRKDEKFPSLTSTPQCLRFSLADIQSATKDFDDELVIGHGGFGKVYRGSTCIEETSHVVAIKRLDSKSEQGAPEFRAEIEMLSKLRHCHLVSLIGFCDDNKEMILVYAYMPNGTLYHHLHRAETPLNWVQRLRIAIGAGRGLDYLHTGFGTQQGVIHRDVKTSNILLDENWEAMISDFGLSKIGPTNESMSYVDASVKGTFGYLDPEYFYTRKLTRQTDVYAFGVVLFELLSGRLPVDERYGEEQCSLVRWAQKCVKEQKFDQMVDSKIKGTILPKCLRQFAQIADSCLRNVLKERPTMAKIVVSLQALLELQQRYNSSTEPSSRTGLTWKIHKYLVSVTKLNADQNGTSSSKSPENNMNPLSSTNKDGKDQGEVPLQFEELVAKDLKSFTYNKLRYFGNSTQLDYYVYVYRGWINKQAHFPSEDNTRLPIAVKRLDHFKCVDRLDLEMLKEFTHPNLEKLIGYCLQGKQLFLVYEFMPNGNFEDLLDSGGLARLPLVTKMKIAVGIARGIVFLNETQYVVGINKPNLYRSRILLDEDFTAKLSGYDVHKLIHGGYPESWTPDSLPNCDIYYPGREPLELETNCEGFAVVFAELLTGKYCGNSIAYAEICNQSFYQHGKFSLRDIAFKCFENCNKVDAESWMLRILEKNAKRNLNQSKHILAGGSETIAPQRRNYS